MTDLATALRHELARDRARMERGMGVGGRLLILRTALRGAVGEHADVVDRLVTELAIATGRSEAVVRLSVGLGGHTDTAERGFSRERAVSGDDRGRNEGGRP